MGGAEPTASFPGHGGTRASTGVELVRSVWRGPYWWLGPVVLLLNPEAIVFILLQSAPLVAPFLYTVF